MQPEPLALATTLAERYAALSQVVAVVLAGSQTAQSADDRSDIDLYVYYGDEPVPMEARRAIAETGAERLWLGNEFFESGDEWFDAATGIGVDLIVRHSEWIEGALSRVLDDHQASVGYSTCFWHNVLTSRIFFDRDGWFERLQAKASQLYPEPLRRAIVAKNHPILRNSNYSFLYQLQRAVEREDIVSVNHRVAAILASYFDILFAVNRLPHPGEKKLLAIAARQCSLIPVGMDADVRGLIRASGEGKWDVLSHANNLFDGLDRLLKDEGLLTE